MMTTNTRNIKNILSSILFNLYLILMTVTYASLCLLVFLFMSKNARYYMIKYWCKHFVSVAWHICGIKYNISGMQYLVDAQQNVQKNTEHRTHSIILANHQSAWETIAFIALFPQRLCLVFKRELIFIPFFGWVLALLDMLHINRKHGIRAFAYLSKQTSIKLSLGYTPLLFPQGTRALPHQQLAYKSGGVRLAMQNHTNIIHVSHNSGEMWAKNSFIKRAGLVNIIVGKPIEYINIKQNNIKLEELNMQVQQLIEHNIVYNNE
jgi:1-acyl-sn-glycerol-3-phosphate acyltransferase